MTKLEKHQHLIGKLKDQKAQKRAERKAYRQQFRQLLHGNNPLPPNLILPLLDCTPGTRFQGLECPETWGVLLAVNDCSARVYLHDHHDTRIAPTTMVRTMGVVFVKPETPQTRPQTALLEPGTAKYAAGVDTSSWDQTKSTAQWALKRIALMEARAHVGDWDGVVKTYQCKANSPLDKYQKAVIQAQKNLLAQKE